MAFSAKYRGQCSDCGEWFPEGTVIKYDENDQIVHENCDDAEDLPEPGVPCPECHMVHSRNQQECW